MIFKTYLKGQLTYQEALDLQIEAFSERVDRRKRHLPLPEDIVFCVEHRPVYTLGKHGDFSHLLMSETQLHDEGIEFVRIERGGDITYHGPGQLTVYPIIDLQRYGLGVKDYVWLLEETVIRIIARYGIRGERIEGKTGVWVGKDTPGERKISAIGVKCSRHVAMHGFALNVQGDISGFSGIVPCGLSKGVTSISLETGEEEDMEEVALAVKEELTSLLQPRIPAPGIP